MRAINYGKHFLNVAADRVSASYVSGASGGEERPFDGSDMPPVFSETFLYEMMYKEDARFVLGIAEEYANIIDILGVDRVRELLSEHVLLDCRELRRVARDQEAADTSEPERR